LNRVAGAAHGAGDAVGEVGPAHRAERACQPPGDDGVRTVEQSLQQRRGVIDHAQGNACGQGLLHEKRGRHGHERICEVHETDASILRMRLGGQELGCSIQEQGTPVGQLHQLVVARGGPDLQLPGEGALARPQQQG